MFNKAKKINLYLNYLCTILGDASVRERIIRKVKLFFKKGKIKFDGNNLYAKIKNEITNDYLEIKCENGVIICNYTDVDGKQIVNITQRELQDNSNKIDIAFNEEDRIIKLEKVYNSNNELIYESNLRYIDNMDVLNNIIIFKDNCWSECLELQRTWYTKKGSINYLVYRSTETNNIELKEEYSTNLNCICRENIFFQNSCSEFELNKESFKDFISGKITIETLLEQNENKCRFKTK